MDKEQQRASAGTRCGYGPAAGNGGDRGPERWLEEWRTRAEDFLQRHRRPLVIVSYAQSVDGSIASRARRQLMLSSRHSMTLTHRLRAACDAIAIGINTVLSDNPLLTVRLVEGPSPQPVVLDTNLRIPLAARLLGRTDLRCWIAGGCDSDPARIAALQARGGEVLCCARDRHDRVDLACLLGLLGARGIRSIMVEGGARVISSFIEARLADQLMITIAPRLVGGLPVLDRPAADNGSSLALGEVTFAACGPDIVLWARPEWGSV